MGNYSGFVSCFVTKFKKSQDLTPQLPFFYERG